MSERERERERERFTGRRGGGEKSWDLRGRLLGSLRRAGLCLVAGVAACSGAGPAPAPADREAPPQAALAAPQAAPGWGEAPAIELVETAPVETTLDHPDVPDAHAVWTAMIQGATRTLDVAQFYISNAPEGRLEPVLQAIEAAAGRGVRVRVLVDQSFYGRYPESVERLAARPGIEARRLDMNARTKGVLHAKYFVVDGRDAFLGSQNFDWRALAHIQEIGVRIRHPGAAGALAAIFDVDWDVAGGADPEARAHAGAGAAASPAPALAFPARVGEGGAALALTPVASPRGWLPDERLWDLPRLGALIDGARRSVHVQLLTYKTVSRDGSAFPELDDALRRAAARGVEVRLLLSHWSTRAGTIEPIQRLAEVPGVAIRLLTIPRWSGGFIPFARVAHAKYMVTDGAAAWVGTSNWEGDYFTRSRNVGIVVEGAPFAGRLDRIFDDGWTSPYAAPVDPKGTYPAPSIDRDAAAQGPGG